MTTVHRIALLLLLAGPLHAQVTPLDRARLPFAAVSEAFHLRTTMSLRELRTFVERRMENSALRSAADLFLTAELLKQLGDSRALDLSRIRASRDTSSSTPITCAMFAVLSILSSRRRRNTTSRPFGR